MKLNAETLKTLENLSQFNKSVQFKKGSVVRLRNISNNMIIKAKLSDELPEDFAIFDLNSFLSAVGSMKEPDVNISSKKISMKSGDDEITYVCADSSVVPQVPDQDVVIPEDVWSVTFKLSQDQLTRIQKSAQALGLTDLAVTHEGVVAFDKKLSENSEGTSDRFKLKVDYVKSGNVPTEFSLHFLVNNFYLLAGDYEVKASGKYRAEFKHSNGKIVYWMQAEKSSKV